MFRFDRLSFAITIVPCQTICLTSLIAARAIKDDAFEPSFESVEALLHRPTLEGEGVDFLPLKWKEEMLDRPVFPLDYNHFNRLWHRTLTVAGFREDARIYALRVGTGGRLDGKEIKDGVSHMRVTKRLTSLQPLGVLSDALRNYILSNTTQVFQRNYQPKRVRDDLMKLAFGSMTGQNDYLFQSLRNMSLRRDANAPIDPTPDDLREFEQRKDVSDFRARIEAAKLAGDSSTAKRLKSHLSSLTILLSSLKVQVRRKEYFDNVDRSRALGLKPTAEMAPSEAASGTSAQRMRRCDVAADQIRRFLRSHIQAPDEYQHAEARSERFMNLLLGYLTRRPEPETLSSSSSEADAGAGGTPKVEEGDADLGEGKGNEKERPRCLFGCGIFCHRQSLTRHYREIHDKNGTFNKPFPCPECHRQGMGDSWIANGKSEWSNHVERFHGKIHTPNFPTHACPAEELASCLICGRSFSRGRGLTRHFRLIHIQKEGKFGQPFPCPGCRRLGKEDAWIDGLSAWSDHVASVHGEAHAASDGSDGETQRKTSFSGKKRKRDEAEAEDKAEAEAEAGASDSSTDVMMTDMTTDTMKTSGAQTPASSVDADILLKIDPRLLKGESPPS